jgi:hypothetical protein
LLRHFIPRNDALFNALVLKPEYKCRGNGKQTAKVCAHINHELQGLGHLDMCSDVRAPGPFGTLHEAEPHLPHNWNFKITGDPVGGIPVGFSNPEIQI